MGRQQLLCGAHGSLLGAVQPVEDPGLIDLQPERAVTGAIEPLSLREKIRASGLTFEAIAAEAVRYA